ncbi:MAG TPA: hypothetical protein PLV92_16555 [Pirellulaceae bacterium]|nr:hypothetical protein [Pirellulaceae bacterium]
MQVHCAKCGEEVMGAVNRCWKCHHSFGNRLAAQLPPVRRPPIDGPLDRAPNPFGLNGVGSDEAGGTAVATATEFATELATSAGTALLSARLDETPVVAEASDGPAPENAPRGVRVGSPFSNGWKSVAVALPAAKSGASPDTLTSVRRADHRSSNVESSATVKTYDTRAEAREQLCTAAGYTGLVFGVLSLMLSPWLVLSATFAIVGLCLATWSLLGRNRAIALVAVLICAILLLVSTYRWGVVVYKRMFPPPAWQTDFSDEQSTEE